MPGTLLLSKCHGTVQPHAGGPRQLQEKSQSGTGKFCGSKKVSVVIRGASAWKSSFSAHLWMHVGPPCWQWDSEEISGLTHMILLNPKPHSFAESEPWPYKKLSDTEHFTLVLKKSAR